MTTWRKSSFSDDAGGNCVEVADRPVGGQLIRDSKNPTGAVLAFSADAWTAFVAGTRSGEFD